MPRLRPYVVDGGVAVVTGAAGGIGSALAAQLAAGGSHLLLVDKDEAALRQTADELADRVPGRVVTSLAMDVSAQDAPARILEATLADHGRATLVINNAGVALGGLYEQVSMDDVDWLMAINLRSVMAITSAFLPHLQRGSHITNMSSLFGIIAPVGNATYAAAKHGVKGFSLALRQELKSRGIGVTAVHPGGIRTEIARQARRGAGVLDHEWAQGQQDFDAFLRIPPEVAAKRVLHGTRTRKGRVLIGVDARLGDALSRIAPVGHASLLDAAMRRRTTSP